MRYTSNQREIDLHILPVGAHPRDIVFQSQVRLFLCFLRCVEPNRSQNFPKNAKMAQKHPFFGLFWNQTSILDPLCSFLKKMKRFPYPSILTLFSISGSKKSKNKCFGLYEQFSKNDPFSTQKSRTSKTAYKGLYRPFSYDFTWNLYKGAIF